MRILPCLWPELLTDPAGVRDSYLKALHAHIDAIEAGCRRLEIDYVRLRTDTDLGHEPDWELRGKHLDVRFDNYARMTNARLDVRGVPVLYLPYLVFPTKQTRQSGWFLRRPA